MATSDLFAHHSLSNAELVNLNLNPQAAAQTILQTGATIRGSLNAIQDSLLIAATHIIYRALLDDPVRLPGITQEIQRQILERTDPSLDRRAEKDLPAPSVPLESAISAVGAQAAPAKLIRARSGTLPFVDHSGRLESLVEWLAGPSFDALVIGGPSGSGKTRLAVEICQYATDEGWIAGLLTATDSTSVEALVATESPRLIVIDYADYKIDQLNALIPRIRDNASILYPVRVLFLVRSSSYEQAAWRDVLREGASDDLDNVLDYVPTRSLGSISIEGRQAIFAQVCARLRDRVGQGASSAPSDDPLGRS